MAKDAESTDLTSPDLACDNLRSGNVSKSAEVIEHVVAILIMSVPMLFAFWTVDNCINLVPTPVTCLHGKPCWYPEEVDLRVIVLTYNRPASLERCLRHLTQLILDGDTAMLEVWIDTASDGTVDYDTLSYLQNFSWPGVQHRVHIQKQHAGLYGQWLNTWRPRVGIPAVADTTEIALYLEDDVDVSPFAYRWLKAAYEKYRRREDVAGITLQDEYIITASGRRRGVKLKTPEATPIYGYKIVGPWGFSPHPKQWTRFQDWYHQNASVNSSFRPYLTEAGLYDTWYRDMESQGRSDSMWIMHFVYFCHWRSLYTLYANLKALTGEEEAGLVVNRRENGLHFVGRRVADSDKFILTEWKDSYVDFDQNIALLNYDGF